MNKYTLTGILIFSCIILLSLLHLIFDKIILKKQNKLHHKFFKNVLNAVVICIFLYIILSQFDETKDISKTLFQSGTLVIAILTFAAQQTLGNIISGFSISSSKPFEVGEKVRIVQNGSTIAEGIVKDITLRHVVIKQYDGQSYLVPNSVVNSSVVVNANYDDNVGNFLEVEISYESDLEKAIEIFKYICINNELVIKKEDLNIRVNRMTSNGIILKTTIWTKTLDDNFKACSDIRKELIKQYFNNQIIIPYNTITISK